MRSLRALLMATLAAVAVACLSAPTSQACPGDLCLEQLQAAYHAPVERIRTQRLVVVEDYAPARERVRIVERVVEPRRERVVVEREVVRRRVVEQVHSPHVERVVVEERGRLLGRSRSKSVRVEKIKTRNR
jgi:hypothetical protein